MSAGKRIKPIEGLPNGKEREKSIKAVKKFFKVRGKGIKWN